MFIYLFTIYLFERLFCDVPRPGDLSGEDALQLLCWWSWSPGSLTCLCRVVHTGLGDWIFVVIKYGPGTLELNGKSSHKQNVSLNVDVCRQDDAGICHFMLNDGFRWTLLVACRGQEG